MEGIADIERAHSGVEVREEHDALVIHRGEALVRGMRAEAPAAAAEVAALLGHGPARHADRPRFIGDVDENDHLARLLALVSERFPCHCDDVALARLAVLGELRDLHAQDGKRGVRAELRREIEARDLRIDEVPGRGLLRTVQELFAVDDLQHALAVRPIGEIDAVAPGTRGDGAVQGARHGPARAGLVPGQPEIADEDGFRRIGEIVDLWVAPHAPALDARDEKRDAGIALPPALVRALELADDGREDRRLRRVGHVPDLVRGVAVVAQQIDLALVAPGQLGAVAHAHHLRAARLVLPRLAGNVGEVARTLGVGHVEDGSAVGLLPAAQGIARGAAVMTDVGDPAAALPVDERLIGAAALQVVEAHQLHIVPLDLLSGRAGTNENACCKRPEMFHINRSSRRLPSPAFRRSRTRCGFARRTPREP